MAGKAESNTISVVTDQPLVPMLKGANYNFWSIRMQTLFKSQELWDLVEKGFEDKKPEKPDKKLKKNRINDAKALFLIQQALDDDVFPLIASATTSTHAWHILKQQYLGDQKVAGDKEKEIKEETSISVPNFDGNGGESSSTRSATEGKKDEKEEGFENAMLIVLTLIITLTYQALLNPPSTLFKQGTEINWTCLLTSNAFQDCPAKVAFLFLFLNTAIFIQSIVVLLWTLRGRRVFLLGGLTLYLTSCYLILLIPFSYYIARVVIPLFLLSTIYSVHFLSPTGLSIMKDMKRKERNP